MPTSSLTLVAGRLPSLSIRNVQTAGSFSATVDFSTDAVSRSSAQCVIGGSGPPPGCMAGSWRSGAPGAKRCSQVPSAFISKSPGDGWRSLR